MTDGASTPAWLRLGALAYRKTHGYRAAAVRRSTFERRIAIQAAAVGSTVDCEVDPSVTVGRSLRVHIEPGTHSSVRIGAGARLGDDVQLLLRGGEVLLGDQVDIRARCVLNVAGRLELEHGNVISWGSVIHCSRSITFSRWASLSEYCTVVDSTHFYTEAERHYYHNTSYGSVRIGVNTWVCPKATITRNVTIGDHCIIASGTVVTTDVPDGWLVSGVPGVAIRPVRRPWLEHPGS